MISREKQLKLLKKYINGNRLTHSLNTEKTAIKLAKIHNVDKEKAAIAGLMHDIAKYISKDEMSTLIKKHNIKMTKVEKLSPYLLHGKFGALILKDNGITSKKVLAAVENHTLGKKNMSDLEKIIYLADLIEPNRKFRGIKRIRFYAKKDLDVALLESMKLSILGLIKSDRPIHPKTMEAYNSFLLKNIY